MKKIEDILNNGGFLIIDKACNVSIIPNKALSDLPYAKIGDVLIYRTRKEIYEIVSKFLDTMVIDDVDHTDKIKEIRDFYKQKRKQDEFKEMLKDEN